jgi:hypothetical protein
MKAHSRQIESRNYDWESIWSDWIYFRHALISSIKKHVFASKKFDKRPLLGTKMDSY